MIRFPRLLAIPALLLALVALPLLSTASAADNLTTKAPKDTVMFVRIQSLDSLFDGWNKYAMSVGGVVPQLPLKAQLGQALRNPMMAGIDMTAPVGIALVMPPQDDEAREAAPAGGPAAMPEPKPLIYLPLSDADVFSEAMEAGNAPYAVKLAGDYAVLADNEDDLALSEPAGKVLPVPQEMVAAWIDMKTLEPRMSKQLTEIQQGMKMMAQMQPQSAQQFQMMSDLAATIQENIKQTDSITMIGKLDADNVRIETQVNAAAGSEFAKTLASVQQFDARILQHLPKDSFAVLGGAMSGQLVQMVSQMQTMQLKGLVQNQDDKKLVDQLMQKVEQIQKAVGDEGLQFAGGMTASGPAKGIEFVAVTKLADPQTYREVAVESTELMQKMMDRMPQQPGAPKMTMNYRKGAVQIEGVSVDRFEMDIEFGQMGGGMVPVNPQMVMQTMFGGEKFVELIAYFDDYAVVVTGPGARELLRDVIVSVKQNKAMLTTTPMHVSAMKRLPDNATVLGYLDPKGMAKWLASLNPMLVPPPIQQGLNNMALSKGAFSMAVTSEKGAGTLIVNIPSAATKDLMEVIELVQQGMQQMRMGPGPGGPPAPM